MKVINQLIATRKVNKQGNAFTFDNSYSCPAVFADTILQRLCRGKQVRIVASITEEGGVKIDFAEINLAV